MAGRGEESARPGAEDVSLPPSSPEKDLEFHDSEEEGREESREADRDEKAPWKAVLASIQEKFEVELKIVKNEVVDLKQFLFKNKKDEKAEKEKEETEKKEMEHAVETLKTEVEIMKNFKIATLDTEENRNMKNPAEDLTVKFVILEERLKETQEDMRKLLENVKNMDEVIEREIVKSASAEKTMGENSKMLFDKSEKMSKDLKIAYENVDKLKQMEKEAVENENKLQKVQIQLESIDMLVTTHEDALISNQEKLSIVSATLEEEKVFIKNEAYEQKKKQLKCETMIDNVEIQFKKAFDTVEKEICEMKKGVDPFQPWPSKNPTSTNERADTEGPTRKGSFDKAPRAESHAPDRRAGGSNGWKDGGSEEEAEREEEEERGGRFGRFGKRNDKGREDKGRGYEKQRHRKGEESSGEESDDGAKIKSIRGYDHKSAPKPDKFDLNPADFENWRELFAALMLSMDENWEIIMREFTGKKALKSKDIDEILTDKCSIRKAVQSKVKSLLYVNLISYTKGEALGKVRSNSSDMSLESFRWIVSKGKNASTSHKM